MIFYLILPLVHAMATVAAKHSHSILGPDFLKDLDVHGKHRKNVVIQIDETREISSSSGSGESRHHYSNDDCNNNNVNYCNINDGWRKFTRSGNREVCLKYLPTGTNPDIACKNIGAKIAGIEQDSERSYVFKTAKADFDARGVRQGGVWIGAERDLGCVNCPVEHQFYWTDGFTTSLQQLTPGHWANHQPDFSRWYSQGGERCLALTIKSPFKDMNGNYNDIPCEFKPQSNYGDKYKWNGMFGTVCGKSL